MDINNTVKPTNKRDESLDLLKFITIFMVITGHTFQCLGYDIKSLDIFPINIFTLIQMPQFMFITGYVSYRSIENRSFKYLAETRWKSLLRPMIVYSLIIYLGTYFSNSDTPILYGIIRSYFKSYWFIWAVVYCLLFMYVCRRLLKYGIALITILSVLVCSIPPEYSFIPHFSYFQAMLPFFILGFYCKKYDLLLRYIDKVQYILPVSLIIFIACVPFYSGSHTFYFFSDMTTIEHLKSFILMLIAGVSGIISCYYLITLLLKKITNLRFAITAGQYTFAMYMIQGIVFKIFSHINIDLHYYVLYWIAAISIFIIINLFIVIIKRSKLLSLILLGKS